jgi:hypothetical protein
MTAAPDFATTDAVALRLVLAVLNDDSDAHKSTLNELDDDHDALREVARYLAGMVVGCWKQAYGDNQAVFITSVELALAVTLDALDGTQ